MNRRRFVALIVATPIGAWAATHLPSVVTQPKQTQGTIAQPYLGVAKPASNYEIRSDDDFVEMQSASTLTLPVNESNPRNVYISAPLADVTVRSENGEWKIAQGKASLFSSVQGKWFQVV